MDCNGIRRWQALIQMYQTALKSIDGSLRSVTRAHLVEKRAYMDANRLLRNSQLLGNLAVTVPAGNAVEHLHFARREMDRRHAFCEPVERNVRKVTQTAMNLLDCIDQLLAAGGFCEISHCPKTYGAINILAAAVVGEDNNPNAGQFLTKLDDEIKTAHKRQART